MHIHTSPPLPPRPDPLVIVIVHGAICVGAGLFASPYLSLFMIAVSSVVTLSLLAKPAAQ
ncbi:hypothetical protein TSOC_003543 [Tetrabaena socialis]|uniref:Uncharacterized protein n=1 Tax=Tetrabaena socialis TaxID=47790 RepID=A0A2J8ABC1_9CHLO|nr:hypothetical protein TSOC_003543 [Tetrabaena socialis]|eukprot:PNH09825.1 hypothetical protein TSOC_003543 [Tetrabaena socialis]